MKKLVISLVVIATFAGVVLFKDDNFSLFQSSFIDEPTLDLESPINDLQNIIDGIETAPKQALAQLKKIDSLTSKAFQAYILFEGDSKSAEAEHIINLAGSKVADGLVREMIEYSEEKEANKDVLFLTKLRLIMEYDSGRDISAPCFIFERHPTSAYQAFDAYWGSTRDSFAHCIKANKEILNIIEIEELYNFLENNVANGENTGTSRYSHSRRAYTYLLKAWISPEYNIKSVGMPVHTFEEFKEKYPVWQGLNEMQNLYERASQKLAIIYQGKGLDKEKAHQSANEILEAYTSYRLLRGLVR